MRAVRLRPIRTLASLLLALCFGIFSAEALLADVHDHGLPAWGHPHDGATAVAEHPAHAVQPCTDSHTDAQGQQGDQTGHTHYHGTACHDGHSHLVLISLPFAAPTIVAIPSYKAIWDGPPRLASRTLDSPLRPPIA